MQLLIATKNPGKFSEIREVLRGLHIKLLSLADAGLIDDVEETGETHQENAVLKARYFFDRAKIPTLAEDSGIYLDAFPAELGLYTRRWGGNEKASDEQWIQYFLEKLKGISTEKRGARFICHAALILDRKSYHHPLIFVGETRGVITEKLEAPLLPGIPISSCFQPVGFDKVYAALTVEEKNRVSHRGQAMEKVKNFLFHRARNL